MLSLFLFQPFFFSSIICVACDAIASHRCSFRLDLKCLFTYLIQNKIMQSINEHAQQKQHRQRRKNILNLSVCMTRRKDSFWPVFLLLLLLLLVCLCFFESVSLRTNLIAKISWQPNQKDMFNISRLIHLHCQ